MRRAPRIIDSSKARSFLRYGPTLSVYNVACLKPKFSNRETPSSIFSTVIAVVRGLSYFESLSDRLNSVPVISIIFGAAPVGVTKGGPKRVARCFLPSTIILPPGNHTCSSLRLARLLTFISVILFYFGIMNDMLNLTPWESLIPVVFYWSHLIQACR